MHNEYHSFNYLSIKVICEQKVNIFLVIKQNIVVRFGIINLFYYEYAEFLSPFIVVFILGLSGYQKIATTFN